MRAVWSDDDDDREREHTPRRRWVVTIIAWIIGAAMSIGAWTLFIRAFGP